MKKQDEILERIKELRKKKGITQLEMSEKIGMAKNNYGKVENGHIELTINRLYEIADILEVSDYQLLGHVDTGTEIETLRKEKNELYQVVSGIAPVFDFIKDFLGNRGNNERKDFQVHADSLSPEFKEKLAESMNLHY